MDSKVKTTFAIFKSLANERIELSRNSITLAEAYTQILNEIKLARSLNNQKETRDGHGRLIRNLIESIDQISGYLFTNNFQVTGEHRQQILSNMIALGEAILIYPFGKKIKLVPTVELLETDILRDFDEAIELAEIDKQEAYLSLMEVETKIYKWREIAEKDRLAKLELGYKIIKKLKEKEETKVTKS